MDPKLQESLMRLKGNINKGLNQPKMYNPEPTVSEMLEAEKIRQSRMNFVEKNYEMMKAQQNLDRKFGTSFYKEPPSIDSLKARGVYPFYKGTGIIPNLAMGVYPASALMSAYIDYMDYQENPDMVMQRVLDRGMD